jgi:signal transduction histidine kinase
LTTPEFILLITGASLLLLLLLVAVILLFRIYVKRKTGMLIEVRRFNDAFEKTLLSSQLEIQQQTLELVKKEWHDNFSQILSLSTLQLCSLVEEVPVEKQKKLDEIIANNDLIQKGMMKLIRSLKPSYSNPGLFSEIIATDLKRIADSGLYETELKVSGTEIKMNAEVEIILYRMAQEILNNIIKHAKATSIIFKIACHESCLIIEITDNGDGFDLNKIQDEKKGMGMKNLIGRAKDINASIQFQSARGRGTSVSITLRLQ